MENSIFQEKKISKAYIVLSIPLVMSMVVTLIYNLSDTFFVAQTNNTDLVAGVSLGTPIFTLLMAVGNIFAQGGSSLISRLLGQQEQDDVRRVSSFSFYVAIITGAVIGAFLLVFRTPVLYVLGANAQTIAHASAYYTWLAIGATVIGYLCTDIFLGVVVLRKSQSLSIQPKIIRIPGRFVGQILGIGIPAALVNILQSISMVLTNQFLLPFGNEAIAAMGIAQKISMIASRSSVSRRERSCRPSSYRSADRDLYLWPCY